MNLYHAVGVTWRRGSRGVVTQAWPLLCQESTVTSQEDHNLVDPDHDEDLIEQKRNKSKLQPHHYKRYYKQQPLELTEDRQQVSSLTYLRKLYARHGAASGISPALLWPSKEEMAFRKEWESVAYPDSVFEMISCAKKQKAETAQRTAKRQADLQEKVGSLQRWKREVQNRVANKEREMLEAKARKERQIEEVRQIFGFRIDPKDLRFKEALEQKEKEEKKAAKAAKKLARQQKLIEQLKGKTTKPSTEETATSTNEGSVSGQKTDTVT